MVQVSEEVWNAVAGATVLWRQQYEKQHVKMLGRAATRPDDNVQSALWDAAELILRPPRVVSARDAVIPDGVFQYNQGPSYERVIMEMRKRNLAVAAHFLENDLNINKTENLRRVDPDMIREIDGVVEYRLIADAPEMPYSPHDSVQFLIRHGNLSGFPGDKNEANKMLAMRVQAGQVRSAVQVAAAKGHFQQANQAALILAQHYGFESQDVNPYPDNSTSPWMDVIAAR